MKIGLIKKNGITGLSIGLIVCFSLTLAQGLPPCVTGPVTIVCHCDPGFTNNICCGWLPIFGCDVVKIVDPNTGTMLNSPGVDGVDIKAPVTAYVITCGPGNSTATATAFQGTCAWNETGTTCGTAWGPVAKSASVDLFNCEGACSNGG